LVRGLRIVFAVFAEDMGADVQSTALLFSRHPPKQQPWH
jgi:hypothetical protein